MIDFVPRTCTEIGEDGQVKQNPDRSKRTCLSFEEFRDADAYVLLGPPGAGKTTTFKQEADCSKACYVTARDFIAFAVDKHPEWHNTTLFIDGLDEKRAGAPDDAQHWMEYAKGSNNWIAPGSGFPAVRPTGSVPMTESI